MRHRFVRCIGFYLHGGYMKHDFTEKHQTPHFEIQISPATHYGYFEHNDYGDELGGGLWFSPDKKLLDYDGVFELPREVFTMLVSLGYDLSDME